MPRSLHSYRPLFPESARPAASISSFKTTLAKRLTTFGRILRSSSPRPKDAPSWGLWPPCSTRRLRRCSPRSTRTRYSSSASLSKTFTAPCRRCLAATTSISSTASDAYGRCSSKQSRSIAPRLLTSASSTSAMSRARWCRCRRWSTCTACSVPNLPRASTRYRGVEIFALPAPGYSTGQAMNAVTQVANEVLPNDMGYAWNGISYQQSVAGGGGAAVFALSLVLVFLILAALYESWSLPFSVLLSVPVAVCGAFFGLWSRNLDNDVYAQIGLIMLIGL